MRHTIGGLESLLRALRAEGIAIGTLELTRLHAAFRAGPELSAPQVATLLCCTLVKQPEHVETFYRLFDAWLQDAEGELRAVKAPRLDDAPFQPPSTPPPPPTRRWLYLALLALTTGILLWLWWPAAQVRPSRNPIAGPPANQSPPQPLPQPTPPTTSPDLPSVPVATYQRWQATVDREHSTFATVADTSRRWLLLLPMGLALAVAALTWRAHLRPRRTGHAPPLQSGPTDEPMLMPAQPDRSLLSAAEARLVVAGVDSFVAEEASQAIDLPRTVDATAAAAGIPTLVALHQRLPREVWLWRDHTTSSPTAHLLVSDLAHALQRGGHTARIAAFYGDLSTITWAEGETISPWALEAHRQQALVGVFTDGDALRLHHASATTGPSLRQQLTALSRWPRFAFIDCATPSLGLAHLAAQYDIRCLCAAEAPAFVGLHRRAVKEPTGAEALHYELGDWAQVLALWPGMFRESDALDVHHRLGLSLPRYRLQSLLAHASELGIGYAWPGATRAQLVHRLASAAIGDRDGLIDETARDQAPLLTPAASYWIDRFTAEDELRTKQQTAMAPWTDTEAQARLHMERALVRLWVDPTAAAAELEMLSRRRRLDAPAEAAPALQATITKRLADYRSDATVTPSKAHHGATALPWRWRDLPPMAQLQLWQLGFAKATLRLVPWIRPAKQTLLALGLCLGVLSAILSAWLTPGPTPSPTEPPTFATDLPAPGLVQVMLPVAGMHFAIYGEPASLQSDGPVDPGARVALQWQRLEEKTTAEQWDRGSRPELLPRPSDWPMLSVAILRATSEERDARQLAIRLLDSGTVDRVVFNRESTADAVFASSRGRLQQLLVFSRTAPTSADRVSADLDRVDVKASAVVTHADFASLALELNRDGLANDVWSGHCEVSRTSPRVRGGWLVAIPGDSFVMGSAAGEADRFEDEGRQHSVAVPPFQIWRTELTRSEFRGVMPDHLVPPEWLPDRYPQVGTTSDQCRNGQYVRIAGKDGDVLIGISQTKWVDLPSVTSELTWYCGDNRERVANDRPFNALLCHRSDDGEITWTFVAKTPTANDGLLPANYVDFATSVLCCNALSRRDGLAEYYEVKGEVVKVLGGLGYRLPSEAEWEYACRGGTTTRYWSGDSEADLARVGWYSTNSGRRVHVVGERPANAFGLHDMHGNVWEWCEDSWHPSYQAAPADGSAWVDTTSAKRVARGGSFGHSAKDVRSAARSNAPPDRRDVNLGFRPARSVVLR